MLVQLVLQNFKDPAAEYPFSKPFDLFEQPLNDTCVILVPSLEDYHAVQGELLIKGISAKVVCLLPPSRYMGDGLQVPYSLYTDTYMLKAVPSAEDTFQLIYHFEKKDDSTTNQVHE